MDFTIAIHQVKKIFYTPLIWGQNICWKFRKQLTQQRMEGPFDCLHSNKIKLNWGLTVIRQNIFHFRLIHNKLLYKNEK